VLHTLLSELEHEEKLPRRLVAALQSMFTTAAGARQDLKVTQDITNFVVTLLSMYVSCRVTELLCHLSCYVLGQQMQEHYSQEARHSSYGHTKGTQYTCLLTVKIVDVDTFGH